MSDMHQKREFVIGMYPGAGWRKKVNSMPDGQVLAIYMREQNKRTEAGRPKPKKDQPDIPF